MNRAQKMAWLIVITITAALLLTGISVGIIYAISGFPAAAGTAHRLRSFRGRHQAVFSETGGQPWQRDIEVGRRPAQLQAPGALSLPGT